MSHVFWIEDGLLWIRDSTGSRSLPVDGMHALSFIPTADDRAIVLLEATPGYRPVQNIVLIDRQGEVRWRAELPTSGGGESYTSFSQDGRGLVAQSWSGHKVVLDPGSGRILSRTFNKG